MFIIFQNIELMAWKYVVDHACIQVEVNTTLLYLRFDTEFCLFPLQMLFSSEIDVFYLNKKESVESAEIKPL